MTTRVVRGAAAVAALAVALCGWGCGKKGPPLAPFVLIPASVDAITASRLGSDVVVTLTVPLTNIDASTPIDISRIDVYAYTGRVAPTPLQWGELGTVIATVPVALPPVDETGAPLPPAAVMPDGALPGSVVTILDALTPDEMVQGALPPVDPQRPALAPPLLPGVIAPTVLRRFYLAIPVSQNDVPGPPGTAADLVLTMLPAPPTDVRASYLPTALSLAWDPSGGLLGFLLDRPWLRSRCRSMRCNRRVRCSLRSWMTRSRQGRRPTTSTVTSRPTHCCCRWRPGVHRGAGRRPWRSILRRSPQHRSPTMWASAGFGVTPSARSGAR